MFIFARFSLFQWSARTIVKVGSQEVYYILEVHLRIVITIGITLARCSLLSEHKLSKMFNWMVELKWWAWRQCALSVPKVHHFIQCSKTFSKNVPLWNQILDLMIHPLTPSSLSLWVIRKCRRAETHPCHTPAYQIVWIPPTPHCKAKMHFSRALEAVGICSTWRNRFHMVQLCLAKFPP